MVFVYLILLGVLAFSWKAKEKASKRVWMLAFTAFFLAFVIFIYHSLSPLEVHL
jgi:high-affinity Fe2+/Pb2+ permease